MVEENVKSRQAGQCWMDAQFLQQAEQADHGVSHSQYTYAFRSTWPTGLRKSFEFQQDLEKNTECSTSSLKQMSSPLIACGLNYTAITKRFADAFQVLERALLYFLKLDAARPAIDDAFKLLIGCAVA